MWVNCLCCLVKWRSGQLHEEVDDIAAPCSASVAEEAAIWYADPK